MIKKEYVLAAVSIFLWSTSAAVAKLLLNDFSAIQIVFVGSIFACLSLFLLNCVTGKIQHVKSYGFGDIVKLFFTGILGMFLYDFLLYTGMDLLPAQEAFIINYMWPALTIVFSCLILKESFGFKKMTAVIFSFIGIIIVSTHGDFSFGSGYNFRGILACLAAAACYGLFSVINMTQSYNKSVSMMFFYGFSAIISGVYILLTHQTFTLSLSQTLGLGWIGIFTCAAAYTSWAMALDTGDTAKISNLAYITPFASLIFIRLLIGEEISPYSVFGLVLIMAGVLIQLSRRSEVSEAKIKKAHIPL